MRKRRVARRVFRGGLLLLDAALILLFLAGYAARYVHPRHVWWIQLIAIGLPFLSLLVLGATAGAAMARRWRPAAVHLALTALIMVRFVPFERFAREAGADPEALTLMTFNAGWGWTTGGDAPGGMAELIRREMPDLVALQEAEVTFSRRAIPVRPSVYVAPLVDSLDYRIHPPGNATHQLSKPVLSRFPLDDLAEHTLRPGGDEVNELVRATFTWQGRAAVLYNVHLRTFGGQKPWDDDAFRLFDFTSWIRYARQYRDAFLIRARQIEQIRRMTDAETLPVLICGDFNSTPHNWGYRRMTDGLTDAFRVAGSGWGATYHQRLPFVRIDYVLASPEWEVTSARVAGAGLSDHRALVVGLRWRAEERGSGDR